MNVDLPLEINPLLTFSVAFISVLIVLILLWFLEEAVCFDLQAGVILFIVLILSASFDLDLFHRCLM